MTLRDLPIRQITKFQKRCDKEYKDYKKIHPYTVIRLDQWRMVWSSGLKAGLEYVK